MEELGKGDDGCGGAPWLVALGGIGRCWFWLRQESMVSEASVMDKCDGSWALTMTSDYGPGPCSTVAPVADEYGD